MRKQKLKYYLRGLGIGMLVTAFILGVTDKEEISLSDAQIRERAMELGMVDADSIMLSDLKNKNTDESEAVIVDEETTETNEIIETETAEEILAETQEVTPETEVLEETSEESSEEKLSEEAYDEPEEPSDGEVVETADASKEIPEIITITIRSGASSYSVSKDLAAAGLVEDAGDYDTYLCDNGYSRKIRIGTYEIAMGTEEEEIAKIITGKR